MFRYLVSVIPDFRLDRCGWQPDQSVVLVDEQRSALRVQASTSPVQKRGVESGMTLAAARALIPEVEIELLDRAAEIQDLEELAAQLLRISPSVAAMPPDSLVAEVGRTHISGHRLGDIAGRERAILERTRLRLESLGHSSTVVIADDPATAQAIARWGGESHVIPPGEGRVALAQLPLDALGLPKPELAFLHGLGLQFIREFAALPSASVATRMGAVGVAAHTMARGESHARLLTPRTEQRPLMLSQDLLDPVVQLDALLFIVNSLLRDACARLAAEGQAACQISLHFTLERGVQSLPLQLGEPTRDPSRVLRILRHRLERFQLSGPVTALALEVSESAPFDGKQSDLSRRAHAHEAIADVTARLQDSLGRSRVSTPELQNRHRPETSWRPIPAQSSALSQPRTCQRSSSQARLLDQDPVHHWLGCPEAEAPPRPPLMLEPPLRVDVRTPPEGIPLKVQVDGGWLEIVSCSGPEKLETEWWSRLLSREYWRIQLSDGRHAWIYKEDGLWALHGWWDR